MARFLVPLTAIHQALAEAVPSQLVPWDQLLHNLVRFDEDTLLAKVTSPYKPSQKAKTYIRQIQLSWQSAFESIIEVGKILNVAQSDLSKKDWHDMVTHELPFTRRTAEKLIKIAADTRITDPKNAHILPPRWTSLEAITRLSDKQFREAVKKGVIHAEAERKDIEAIAPENRSKTRNKSKIRNKTKPRTPDSTAQGIPQIPVSPEYLALSQNDQRRPVAGQATDIVVAEISAEQEISREVAVALEEELAALCEQHGVTLKLSGNLKHQVLIDDLEEQLEQKISDFNWDARDNDLTVITDAFYQLETGKKFPKNADGSFKKSDLRNPDNEFHDFDKAQLYGYCQDLQLQTQYTPIDFLDRQAFVQMLAWRFLTGNQLQKVEAHRSLQALAEDDLTGNGLAQSMLKLLDE